MCGELLSVPMGVDVCYTNHAEADQDDMDTLATLPATAGADFLIGTPGPGDIRLSYQSLVVPRILDLRHRLGIKFCFEFEAWLMHMGRLGVAVDFGALVESLAPIEVISVKSAATDRAEYLRRPTSAATSVMRIARDSRTCRLANGYGTSPS